MIKKMQMKNKANKIKYFLLLLEKIQIYKIVNFKFRRKIERINR